MIHYEMKEIFFGQGTVFQKQNTEKYLNIDHIGTIEFNSYLMENAYNIRAGY